MHSFKEQVTRAEVMFCQFVSENNIQFAVYTDFTRLVKAIFPDSKIVQAFQFQRTKTAAIINGALAPHFMGPVIEQCKKQPVHINGG